MTGEAIHDEIAKIHVQLEGMKFQIARLVSNAESEKGTLQRETDRLYKEIKELEDKIYDPEKGLLLEVDRLKRDYEQRQNLKKNIFALWIAVGSIIVKYLITIIAER